MMTGCGLGSIKVSPIQVPSPLLLISVKAAWKTTSAPCTGCPEVSTTRTTMGWKGWLTTATCELPATGCRRIALGATGTAAMVWHDGCEEFVSNGRTKRRLAG